MVNDKSNIVKIKAQDHLIQVYINQLTQGEVDNNPLLTKYIQGTITQEEYTLLSSLINFMIKYHVEVLRGSTLSVTALASETGASPKLIC